MMTVGLATINAQTTDYFCSTSHQEVEGGFRAKNLALMTGESPCGEEVDKLYQTSRFSRAIFCRIGNS